MLILLAQATHDYRTHLACGVLREHGVEAHVFHENSGVLHGGISTTTASLWVREDEWQDAHEILATAPMEPLPEEDGGSVNVRKEFLPPAEAVAVGIAGAVFATSSLVKIAAAMPVIALLSLDKMFEAMLLLLLSLLINGATALLIGLIVGLGCIPAFAVLRWHRAQWPPAVALLALIGIMMAVCISMSMVL